MNISVLCPTIRPQGLEPVLESLKKQTYKDFEFLVEVGYGNHDLNAAFNRMLKRAKGELIVFYEDYTKVPDDFLATCWELYQKEPRTFWTFPVGKTLDWEQITWDWRKEADEIDYQGWEADLACAPLQALKEIGGFDEELDRYWSCDNLNVALRASLCDYKFKVYNKIHGIAYDHDKAMHHPFREQYNPNFNHTRMEAFKRGFKINYL